VLPDGGENGVMAQIKETISKDLAREYPATIQDFTAVVRTYSEHIVGPFITTMFYHE
jgi:hypothetical protein